MDRGSVDDIDHLGNRRVRSVGEMAGESVPRRSGDESSVPLKNDLALADSEGLNASGL